MSRYFFAAAALLAGAALAAAQPDSSTEPAAGEAVDAQWAEHHVDFNFFGHNTQQAIYYDCDVVEDKLEQLLRMAGARKDVSVRAYGCAVGPERVSAFIRADLVFKSPTTQPQPVSTKTGEAPLHAAATWKPVKLKLGWTNGFETGDCLLVDQFRVQVLMKYFDIRNLTADLPCSIGSLTPRGKVSLQFDALTASAAAEEESIQQEKAPRKHDDKLKSDKT